MSRTSSRLVRLIGPATAAAALIIGSMPAFAQTAPATTPATMGCNGVHFELANPAPGSFLEPGGLVVEGIALDSRATSGNGIDHVDFFLGNRDQGGTSVGMAVPGATAGPFGTGSFHTIIDLPNMTGGNDLWAYAHSSVTGQESVVSVPIAIGEDPVVAGETSENGATPTMMEACMGTATGTAQTAPATTTETTTAPSTTTTPATTTTTTTMPMTGNIMLTIGNPEPSATILSGNYSVEGTAWDQSATSGNGVDRIDVFLDNRDNGGLFLASAQPGIANPTQGSGSQFANSGWRVTVNLPKNQTGLHTLAFYAHSSVTGGEKVIEVPVTIE